MLHHASEIKQAGLGATWPEFRQKLKQIREDGVFVAYGEIDPELVGIGAPVFIASDQIAASITIVVRKAALKPKVLSKLKMLAKNAGAEITRRVIETS
jgi:DNA-binding IclR family transcriptional regulator